MKAQEKKDHYHLLWLAYKNEIMNGEQTNFGRNQLRKLMDKLEYEIVYQGKSLFEVV